MATPLHAATIDPFPIACLMIGLGVITLAWACFENAMGQSSVENPTSFVGTVVRRDTEPARFRKAIVSSVICGVVCLGGRRVSAVLIAGSAPLVLQADGLPLLKRQWEARLAVDAILATPSTARRVAEEFDGDVAVVGPDAERR